MHDPYWGFIGGEMSVYCSSILVKEDVVLSRATVTSSYYLELDVGVLHYAFLTE